MLSLAGEVAGSIVMGVSCAFRLQDRDLLATDGLCFPAARMEVTAARWIDRAGDVTFQDDTFAVQLNVWIWYRDR
jgi:hypothetical protein